MSVVSIISEQQIDCCPRPRRDKIRPWREERKREKTSQSTLLHGGDVGGSGSGDGGSWGYVRWTKNFLPLKLQKNF